MNRVILLETQHLVNAGLRALFKQLNLFDEIVGLDSGKQLFDKLKQTKVDMIIISTNLHDMSIHNVLKKLKRDNPEIRLLVLSNDISITLARKFLHTGAHGYIAKTATIEDFVEAVRKLQQDKSSVPLSVTQSMSENSDEAGLSPFEKLSEREMDILLLLLKGKSVKAISETLYLSPKTISTYKGRIYDKLKVSSLIEVYILAAEYGLVTSHDYA